MIPVTTYLNSEAIWNSKTLKDIDDQIGLCEILLTHSIVVWTRLTSGGSKAWIFDLVSIRVVWFPHRSFGFVSAN